MGTTTTQEREACTFVRGVFDIMICILIRCCKKREGGGRGEGGGREGGRGGRKGKQFAKKKVYLAHDPGQAGPGHGTGTQVEQYETLDSVRVDSLPERK